MGTIKPAVRKKKLAKAMRRTSSVPLWVVLKTGRRVRTSVKKRHWKRTKLKV